MKLLSVKPVAITSLIILFLVSCKPETNLSFTYTIKGQSSAHLNNENHPLNRWDNTFSANGTVTDMLIKTIDKQYRPTTIQIKDSTHIENHVDGTEFVIFKKSMTSINCDTFRLFSENSKAQKFLVRGTVSSDIWFYGPSSNATGYSYQGEFIDTIQIMNSKKRYAQKAAYYAYQTDLVPYLKERLAADTKDLGTVE